jgi:hypothetical protein
MSEYKPYIWGYETEDVVGAIRLAATAAKAAKATRAGKAVASVASKARGKMGFFGHKGRPGKVGGSVKKVGGPTTGNATSKVAQAVTTHPQQVTKPLHDAVVHSLESNGTMKGATRVTIAGRGQQVLLLIWGACIETGPSKSGIIAYTDKAQSTKQYCKAP